MSANGARSAFLPGMSIDVVAEKTMKNTARLAPQNLWLFVGISVGMLAIARVMRTGSAWMLIGAAIGFVLWFALRDLVRRASYKHTQDRLVKDVKLYLQQQPEETGTEQPVKAMPRAERDEVSIPVRAGFVIAQDANPKVREADLVVFDAFPVRENVAVKMDFFPVLLPVCPTS